MTEPTLPPDIAEAIEEFDGWARSWGYQEDQGVGSDVARTMAEYKRARANLEAAILGHLSGGGSREVNSAQKELADRMEAWMRCGYYQPGDMPSSAMQASIGGLVCQHMPMVLAALRSTSASDLGRSALAEEGRGE